MKTMFAMIEKKQKGKESMAGMEMGGRRRYAGGVDVGMDLDQLGPSGFRRLRPAECRSDASTHQDVSQMSYPCVMLSNYELTPLRPCFPATGPSACRADSNRGRAAGAPSSDEAARSH
jgi:hypothetical protein